MTLAETKVQLCNIILRNEMKYCIKELINRLHEREKEPLKKKEKKEISMVVHFKQKAFIMY